MRTGQPKPCVKTTTEFITPKKAQHYLSLFDQNRPLKSRYVEFLAEEILADRWEVTNNGLGFDKKGRGIDGQHRLHAIIKAGKGIWINICRNMDESSKNVIDIGNPRNPQDILIINGVDLGTKGGGIVKQLYYRGVSGNSKLSNIVLLEWANKAAEGIRFINNIFSRGRSRITTASLSAALVRAYYARPHQREKIKEFAMVLIEGLQALTETTIKTTEDIKKFKPVLALQNLLLNQPKGIRIGNTERYFKTERMLQCFLDDQPFNKIVVARQELFPLPWEEEEDNFEISSIEVPVENGKRYFLVPIKTRGRITAENIVKRAFSKKNVRLSSSTHCKQVNEGDKVCFACRNKIVGDAVVSSFVLSPRADKDVFPYEMKLSNTKVYFENPVSITSRICGYLSMAKNFSATQMAASLASRMRALTTRDFQLLTRK